MINYKVNGLHHLTDMRTKVTAFRTQVQRLTKETQLDIQKEAAGTFIANVDELVYQRYPDPIAYERTFHLKGEHGAIEEKIEGQAYEFSIDENSRDPVDGATWKEKADRVESGEMYGYGMPRPFIGETQEKLENLNSRHALNFEKRINDLIDKI